MKSWATGIPTLLSKCLVLVPVWIYSTVVVTWPKVHFTPKSWYFSYVWQFSTWLLMSVSYVFNLAVVFKIRRLYYYIRLPVVVSLICGNYLASISVVWSVNNATFQAAQSSRIQPKGISAQFSLAKSYYLNVLLIEHLHCKESETDIIGFLSALYPAVYINLMQ